ncbi:TetR/AcrR family transcriptional regulator [Rhodococcus qingshengii]|uniref:TetR/AcrR family transcriptional regulator n=1 Tax=Rhodococcus qingshengii TaxID=334542 RepID=UPI0022B2AD78|nr:TetR/AcrR family transcriptional regulator [Rhodococcus qingshengii]MCZ4616494.1 TetR/AcrR family transcriptional regulator [Rhodococcus qingshengii]
MAELSSRDRMIRSAVELISRNGVDATSFSDVIKHSGAPRGSIYHHFPGGKTELMVEAVRAAGAIITRRISSAAATGSTADVIEAVGDIWRLNLTRSDFVIGCPVIAGGLARASEPEVAEVSAEVMLGWQKLIESQLETAGYPAVQAKSMANLTITSVEGAVAVCQTTRSIEPLEQVIASLQGLSRSEAWSG